MHTRELLESLPVMGFGMLGIFVVMFIIYGITSLTTLFGKKNR